MSQWMNHSDHPDLSFRLTYSVGGVLIGFEVADARAISSKAGLLPGDLPTDAEGWDPPEAQITARRLRDVPLGALDTAARNRVATTIGALDEDLRESFEPGQRPGRRGNDDRFYVRVAARYVELLGSDSVILDLASELHASRNTVSNWLVAARRRGLLTSPPKGRAGGQLTERALKIHNESIRRGTN